MKASAKVHLPLLAAVSLALGLGANPARAADARPAAPASANASGVQQLNEEGAALYGARDYRRAIEKFIQAYAVDGDPNLLFNIARCYEELGDIDAAIEKYEVFLKTPGADARGRQRARDSVRALQQSKNATPQGSVAPQAAAAGSAQPESQPTNMGNTGDAADSGGPWPWLTLGGSVVFAAVGTTFYVLGAGDHADITDAAGFDDPDGVSPMTRREADELVSSGNTKKLVGGIGLGVAGALAITYVAMVLSEDEEEEDVTQPSLGFSVSPGRSGAAVSVQGSF
jgi:tetratricopeptide (TPR) repeat protein